MIKLTLALLATTLLATTGHAQDAKPLRIGLVEAPTAGVLFVARGKDGVPDGVVADLGADLAHSLGRPAVFSVFPNTGAATDATRNGQIDVTFMPMDETRRALVDFGPGYYQLESTYLVSGASGITDVAGVNRAGLRVLAISGTTTYRASARTLTATQPKAVPSVGEAVALMRNGEADAFALSRDSLPPVQAEVPGSRIVRGGFQQTLVAVAVAKGNPAEHEAVSDWMEHAKSSGLVRRLFDGHGLQSEAVAP